MAGMSELLDDDQTAEALDSLPAWQRDGPRLIRTVQLESFPQAVRVVNRVAEIAEHSNHHPDIDIRWRKVTFRLSTHSAGGLTAKDVSLAEQIDETIDNL
jgi:4a-hydroxytetrahydrobiopterin dehydratase